MYKKLVGMILAVFLLAIGIVSVIVLLKPESAFAADLEIVGNRLGISITPDTPLFKMENVAPGDMENSTITVKNNGDSTFDFFIESKKENGDESLFKGLNIIIDNNDGTHSYYSGPLDNLKDVKLGTILPNGEEKLNLSIYFPTDIGNELQQKALSVKFVFTARGEDKIPDNKPGDNTSDIDDENIPAGPVTTPEATVSPEPVKSPEPGQTQEPADKTIEDEKIPEGGMPKTGGIPAEVFYAAGLIIVVIGLKMRKQ